jgi:hypothetical protein
MSGRKSVASFAMVVVYRGFKRAIIERTPMASASRIFSVPPRDAHYPARNLFGYVFSASESPSSTNPARVPGRQFGLIRGRVGPLAARGASVCAPASGVAFSTSDRLAYSVRDGRPLRFGGTRAA